jgi:fructose-1,6-bisphosphatase/inositol monophosphatase family enzyme
MKTVDIAAVEKIIAEVAAAEIMPRFRKLGQGDIEMKGVNDPVTIADKAAEEALIARFKEVLPGSVFVGEECYAKDPKIISHFDGKDDVWVIDPIDGTRNFIEGRTEFGVMVALVRRKQTVAAWIHDPNTGDTLMAEQGGGVWMRGDKMHLASDDPAIPKLAIIGGLIKKALRKPESAQIVAALPALAAGSASAFDYGRLFSGSANFANSLSPRVAYILHLTAKCWDHVPGLFLQAEAGGYSAALSGNPYDLKDSHCGVLVAPNLLTWNNLYNAVQPIVGALDATND